MGFLSNIAMVLSLLSALTVLAVWFLPCLTSFPLPSPLSYDVLNPG